MMYAPTYVCVGCGRKHPSIQEARTCEMRDLRDLMREPPRMRKLRQAKR